MSDSNNEYLSKSMERLEKTVDKVDEKCNVIEKTLVQLSTRFNDHLQQDEKMYEEFKHMVSILQENTESLKDHILRTNMLQESVLKMDARLSPLEQERLKREAVREFLSSKAKKWGKLIAMASAGIGVLVGIAKLLTLIN